MFRDEFQSRYTTIPVAVYRADTAWGAEELIAHRHREIELIYMRTGEMDFFVDTEHFRLSAGDLLVIPPYAIHRIPAHKNGRTAHDCICFSASLLCDEALRGRLEGKGCLGAYLLPSADEASAVLSSYMQTAVSSCESMACGWELMTVGCLSLLFGELWRRGAFSSEKSDREDADFSREVIAYVDAHFAEPLSSRTVSFVLHMSQSHFCRVFKAVFGTTFEKYLLAYRLERARGHLRLGELSVTEIAYKTGFHSGSYFGKSFRARYGASPLDFRRAETGKQGRKSEKISR